MTRFEKLLRADGALGLSFLNTASAKRESLETYADLVAWDVAAGTLSAVEGSRLAAVAAEHPGAAAGIARKARALCRRVERIFLAVATGRPVAAADFEPFNADLRRAMGARQLIPTATGYRWSWGDIDGEDLDRALWPVLLSIGELLASPDLERVRRCPDEDCGVWFIARGSGKPRKWCSVACRNRAASRRHYRDKIRPKRAAETRVKKGSESATLTGYGESQPPSKPERG